MHIMCMQMMTAIIEQQIIFNIWKTVHDNNHENVKRWYGSPLFMSHPNLVMSKMGEDLADRLLSTTSPACELSSCETAD